jgi:general L-amino acid transport system permease protein
VQSTPGRAWRWVRSSATTANFGGGSRRLRSLSFQLAALLLIAVIAYLAARNAAGNLDRLGLHFGFDYLWRGAGFRIGESLIPFSPSDSNGWAIFAGVLNTLRVAVLGCILATVIGTFVGIMRLSDNALLLALTSLYVDVLRNVPALLQLVFWYTVIAALPGPRDALQPIAGVFLSNRGLAVPSLELGGGEGLRLAAAVAAAVLGAWALTRSRRRDLGARARRLAAAAAVGAAAILPFAVTGIDARIVVPELRGFNLVGGMVLSPEFATLLFGLTVYTSSYIAEIVRGGILSVSRGQWEAAKALGLSRARTLRLVVLPQSLRAVLPPLTNQWLNLIKGTSIGIAVGYPELVSVSSTMMNLTGQAIEIVAVFMTVYLLISLIAASLMNWFNRRAMLRSR